LLEAGACGTYSLANNCKGGINEIIQPKINGEISDIENHKEFAKKFEILEQNHNKEAIRNSIQSRFSKEIILDKYIEVFENMISSR
jgi:glycosyltransferase involved in cell wall biosynthesis